MYSKETVDLLETEADQNHCRDEGGAGTLTLCLIQTPLNRQIYNFYCVCKWVYNGISGL